MSKSPADVSQAATRKLPRTAKVKGDAGPTLLIVSVIVGVVAIALNTFYLSALVRNEDVNTFTVYQMRRSMPAGARLDLRDLEAIEVGYRFRAAMLALGAIDGTQIDTRLNQRLERAAPRQSLLTETLFITPGEDPLERIQPRPGMAARGIQINDKTAPANLRPGMYVDIFGHFTVDGKNRPYLVMERARVLAAGSQTLDAEYATEDDRLRPIRNFRTITVEVNRDAMRHLAALQRRTSEFELFLRNPEDTEGQRFTEGEINPELLEELLAQR